jgi:hypothetical protein
MTALADFLGGRVPLKQAFWYWGVATWLLLGLIGPLWRASGLKETVDPLTSLIISMCIVIFRGLYILVSAISIVRSAKNYTENTSFKLFCYVVPIVYAMYFNYGVIIGLMAVGKNLLG